MLFISIKSYCLDTDRTLADIHTYTGPIVALPTTKVVDNYKHSFKEETRRGRRTHTHCQLWRSVLFYTHYAYL